VQSVFSIVVALLLLRSLSSLSRAAFFRFVRADRLLTPCLPERDGRRAMSPEIGMATNQVCSLGGGGEHANPAKLFEMVGFPVSPPVNPMPASGTARISDSSGNSRASETSPDASPSGIPSYSATIIHEKRIGNEPFSDETNYFFGLLSEIRCEKR